MNTEALQGFESCILVCHCSTKVQPFLRHDTVRLVAMATVE